MLYKTTSIQVRPNTSVEWAKGTLSNLRSNLPEFLDRSEEISLDGLTRTLVLLFSSKPNINLTEEEITSKDAFIDYCEKNNIDLSFTEEFVE
jgi:hypothetical protein